MSAPDDPTRWPDAPPPLPPTLPTGGAPAPAGGWSPAPVIPPPPAPPGAPVYVAATPPGGAPPPRPSGTRSGLIAAAIAVVVVLALAGTFLVVRTVSSEDTAAPTTPTTTEAPTTTESTEPRSSTTDPDEPDTGSGSGSGTAAAVEAEVADISTFVEEERGLDFKEPVEVTALADDEFEARVLEEFETEHEALETEGALLRAGGLVPADMDIVQTQLDLYGDGVGGFYDPVTKELVVRADSAGPLVRSIIAHELTHALDDQHFDLDRPELTERADGSDWAFAALVEGNARHVEYAYIDQFTAEEQDQYDADLMEMGGGQMDTMFSVPMVLIQMMMSPYDYGAPFVDALLEAGGQERIDEAYREPPTSSEQVLDATKFDGDHPVEVPTPPAEGEIITEGVLGELWTGYLVTEPTELDDLLGGFDPGDLGDMEDDLAALEDMMGDLEELQDLMDSLEDGTADPAEVMKELERLQDEIEAAGGGADGGLPSDSTIPDLGELEDLGDLGGLGSSGTDLGSGFPPVATTDGWGGDRYVVWETADQVCLRVDWVMDTPEALTEFRGVVAAWAARDAAVTVTDPTPDSVRATRCAPQP